MTATTAPALNPISSTSYLPDSRTRVIGIIGSPIEHSITPGIQNAAWQDLRASGEEAEFINLAFRVPPEKLEATVRGAQALGFAGLMVTIPHKQAVLDLCDVLDESAEAMGAANLLHFRYDGKIVGHSSDGWAALKSLEEGGVAIKGQTICIAGGGGAARSLALTLAREGAGQIAILNRTLGRAEEIAEESNALDVRTYPMELTEEVLRASLPHTDLLINATSVGMTPHAEETPVSRDALRASRLQRATTRLFPLAVYDIVYNPLETRLLRDAKSAGCKTVDGLGMLIYTNVYAAKVCTEQELSPQVMREEALRALGESS